MGPNVVLRVTIWGPFLNHFLSSWGAKLALSGPKSLPQGGHVDFGGAWGGFLSTLGEHGESIGVPWRRFGANWAPKWSPKRLKINLKSAQTYDAVLVCISVWILDHC